MWVQSLLDNSTGSHSSAYGQEISFPVELCSPFQKTSRYPFPWSLNFVLYWTLYTSPAIQSVMSTLLYKESLKTTLDDSEQQWESQFSGFLSESWHLGLEAHPYWAWKLSYFTSSWFLSWKIPNNMRRKRWVVSVFPWTCGFLYICLWFTEWFKRYLKTHCCGEIFYSSLSPQSTNLLLPSSA